MNATEAKIIDTSIALLKNNGWTRGTYENDRGEFCAVGALFRATRLVRDSDGIEAVPAETRDKIRQCLDRIAKQHANVASIMYFNDHQAKSVDEVIALFEEAKETC